MNKRLCVIQLEEESDFNSMFDIIFNDLHRVQDYFMLIEKVDLGSKIYNSLRRGKLYKIFGNNFDFVLENKYLLPNTIKNLAQSYETVIVICTNNCFIGSRIPLSIVKKIKNKYKNVIWVLFYLDILSRPHCQYATMLRNNNIFDLVYSFDKKDALNNGLIEHSTPYSRINDIEVGSEIDVYCLLSHEKKLPMLADFAKICENNNVNAKLDVRSNFKYKQMFDDYSFVNFMDVSTPIVPYIDIIKRTCKARCIMEFVIDGQVGNTLRPYEAVCYNKKLLTNNPYIVNFKYYDSRYMRYFEKIDDIDIDWIKEDIEVDYHYKDDFSPINLLKDIKRRIGDNTDIVLN